MFSASLWAAPDGSTAIAGKDEALGRARYLLELRLKVGVGFDRLDALRGKGYLPQDLTVGQWQAQARRYGGEEIPGGEAGVAGGRFIVLTQDWSGC